MSDDDMTQVFNYKEPESAAKWFKVTVSGPGVTRIFFYAVEVVTRAWIDRIFTIICGDKPGYKYEVVETESKGTWTGVERRTNQRRK